MSRAVLVLVATALALLAALASPVRVHAGETQVAFDHSGRFVTIDARLARHLGVFADTIPGFSEARLFANDDSTYVLEISSVRAGRLVRERQPMSALQVASLRGHVEALTRVRGGHALLDRDGRLPLVLGTAGLGLAFYGWALPAAADMDGGSAAGTYLVTASASFFLPWALTRSGDVTSSQSRLALWGATRGIAHGVMIADLLSDDVTWRGGLGWTVGASIGEGVIGYALAKGADMDEGAAATIGVGGDFGLALGAGAAAMSNAWEDGSGETASAMMLGGSFAGVVLGRSMAAKRHYSAGDASVVRSAGTLGAWAGLATTSAVSEDADETAWGGALVLGSVVGLGLGDRLAAGREFPRATGMLIEVGGISGALMGMGLAALSREEDDSGEAIMWGGLIGGTAGFAVTYLAASHATPRPVHDAWNVRLEPTAVASRDDAGHRRVAPALAVRASF